MSASNEAEVLNANKIVRTGEISNVVQKNLFDTIPTEVRLMIYHELLLTEEEYIDLDFHVTGVNGHLSSRDLVKGLHVAILRCNKKIHGEANGVLYGENKFHSVLQLHHMLYRGEAPGDISSRCSRLITKVHLGIYLKEPSRLYFASHAIDVVRRKLNDVVSKLALNNLKLLSIHVTRFRHFNDPSIVFAPSGFGAMRTNVDKSPHFAYYGQECLEPLFGLRATNFVLKSTYVGPDTVAKLKATIEGPKDAAFLTFRLKMEDEEENKLEGHNRGVEC